MNNKIHLSLMLLVCLAAGVVFCCHWDPGNREAGESRHYVTSTVTLLNAGRISFTRQDIRAVEDIFGKLLDYNFPRYSPSDRTLLHKLATVDAKSPDFTGRSYYWGTYSFLCIPVYWFCRTFHIFDSNMFNAFKWANILMLLVPLFAIVFLLKAPLRTKYLMLGAFAFPSAAQYINWASAECCIYMFVTLCLIFLYNREYCRSSLCLSFAATMNYTLAPLASAILFCFLRDHRSEFSFRPFRVKKEFIKNFMLLGCCYLPVFHAAFWTWLQYSSIATMARHFTQSDFVWDRFFAYLFDLNLGIWIYHPVLFTVFLLSAIVIFRKRDRELLILWLAFFGIVFGYSFMFHIQSGMEGISRYGAWSVPVAVYTGVCVLDRYGKTWISGSLAGVSAIFSGIILIWHSSFYSNEFEFSLAARFVLDHSPQMYNPFYPIFFCRLVRQVDYNIPFPAVYCRGRCGKILVSKKHLAGFWNYMKEFDMDNVTYSKIEDQRQKMLRQDRLYYYINLDKNCKLKRRKQVFTAKRLMHIGNARSEKDSIILDKNGTQFGPYIFVPKGNYNVRITGENLDKLHFSCTSEMGKKKHSLENMKCCGTAVEYYVKFRRNASNVEFVSRNLQTEPSKIYNITLTEL